MLFCYGHFQGTSACMSGSGNSLDTAALIIGGGSDNSGIVGRKRRRCDLIRERWCCLRPVWCKEAQEVVVPGRGRNGARQRGGGGCAVPWRSGGGLERCTAWRPHALLVSWGGCIGLILRLQRFF